MINLITNPLALIVYFVSLLIAISVHEFSHALAADSLGDPTPKLQGRLSLNPFVHLDLIGLLFLAFFGFGWGKPVVFDPYNLKQPRRDSAIISLAGPLSNFLMAIAASLILRLFVLLDFGTVPVIFFQAFITLNLVLGVFNLLPIHPLDGFKIVGGLLPKDRAHEWFGLERYGFIFLILLIIPIGRVSMLEAILKPIVSLLSRLLLPSVGIL